MRASNEYLSLRRVLGDLTLLVSTQMTAPESGDEEYWNAVRTDDVSPLARALIGPATDTGRVLAVCDPSDESAPRQFAALQLARLLIASGRSVVLVDAELSGEGFSRGLPDSEREGFVDLVQYGSSPASTVQPTPIAGLAAISAGSFHPAPEESFELAALRRALSQLRALYDWTVIVLPALRAGSNYHELLPLVDVAVLASAATDGRAARLGKLADHLRSSDVKLCGVILFVPRPPAEVEPPRSGYQPLRASSSASGLRWLAGGLVLVVVAAAGWWLWMRGPAEEAETIAQNEFVPPPEPAQGEPQVALQPQAAAPESLAASDSATSSPRQLQTAAATESAPPAVQPTSPSGASTPARQRVPAGGIEAELSRPPLNCWSLHLWSFPDSTEAELAARELRDEGLAPRVLGVDLPERGHWYRVVVGCFERRGDALAARGLMASWPHVDNVGVVRVP